MSQYTAGTISVSAGGTQVTGAGTNFLSRVSPDDTLEIGSNRQYIASIESDTALTLSTPWAGGNKSNAAYSIVSTSVGTGSSGAVDAVGRVAGLVEKMNPEMRTIDVSGLTPPVPTAAHLGIYNRAYDDTNGRAWHKLNGAWVEVDTRDLDTMNAQIASARSFSITDTLHSRSDSPITLQPRFADMASAAAFQFSSADDYAPADSFTDLASEFVGAPVWYSEPAPQQFTNRVSIYASIQVGNQPHPSPKPEVRLALLHNQIGAVHRWIADSSATKNYARPRVLIGKSAFKNFSMKGQNWNGYYNDLVALAENEPSKMRQGFSHVRVINLGPLPIRIAGFWIIHHGREVAL